MSKINAIILKNKCLEYEILFIQVKKYIEKSLKLSNIENIYFADSLENVPSEYLDCDDVIFIKDIAPEIVEYDKLIKIYQSTGAEITFFSTCAHSHTNGIIFNDFDEPIHFGKSDNLAKLDIFILSKSSFLAKNDIINNPFNYFVNFVEIAQTTVINDLSDIVYLEEEFKEQINFHHIENNVHIIDPKNTYISSDVIIGSGTKILPNTIIKFDTVIGENCKIGPNTVIESSKIADNVTINSSQVFESEIGDETTVGPFAYLRPATKLGKKVKIGDFVEIKKSTIGDGSKVSHLTYIGDATVGKKVNFGCGTVVVNYDGFNKYQTIVEDEAFIGCNTNLVSPVKVEKGAITAAGSTVTKTVPKNSLAISRVKQENKAEWATKFREIKSKK